MVTYTSHSKPLAGVTHSDSRPEVIETWRYDANGFLTEWLLDAGGDGAIELRESYDYDNWDRLLSHTRYASREVIDASRFYYSRYGDLDHIEMSQDANGDTGFKQIEVYYYDDYGQCLLRNTIDADGLVDARIRFHWHEGKLVRREHGVDANGVIDGFVFHYRYDGNDLLRQYEARDADRGDVVSSVVFKYDEHGRVVQGYSLLRGPPGTTRRYDRYGRLTEVRTGGEVTTYTNDCPHPPTPATPRP